MAIDGYIASDALAALVQHLGSYHQFRTGSESFQIVQVAPGSDQWPISVQVTVNEADWRTPRTFEMSFNVDDFEYFDVEDTGSTPLAETAEVLARRVLVLIEEWLAIGPVGGINEVKP
ncbi:MAG: hypothetical protein ACR2JX_05790 [Mycobacteriales bacterium]